MTDLYAYDTNNTLIGPISSLPEWRLAEAEKAIAAGAISFAEHTSADVALERIRIERTIRSLGYQAGWAS